MRKMALISFHARPKPRIWFLGLSLLRNSTETLATQASCLRQENLFHDPDLFCFAKGFF